MTHSRVLNDSWRAIAERCQLLEARGLERGEPGTGTTYGGLGCRLFIN